MGRGFGVLGSVKERVGLALNDFVAAKGALAESDFKVGEQKFTDAEQQLTQARNELSSAMAVRAEVLRILDVTGAVRSGDRVLAAGEDVGVAGRHVARGMEMITSASLMDKDGEGDFVSVLEQALGEFRQASEVLGHADESLSTVPIAILPFSIKESVLELQNSAKTAHQLLDGFLDQSSTLLSLLGADQERKYLVLFENNNEMRPTGGFIGTVGLVNIDRGTVESIDVQTVYDPDGQMKEFIAPPEPLRKITDRWYMRDANWFVEFPTSAQTVARFFEKEGGPTVDGVIALTPEVIKVLLHLTGPIEMPSYGVTVNEDNFVPMTQDLVTYNYDREVNRPKAFLRDLTPILLNKVLSGELNTLGVLGEMGRMAREKQLLIYLTDEEIQAKLAEQGWDGSLPNDVPNIVGVVNANIGGHKSDQFIEQEIDYRVSVGEDGDTEAILTIRRTHRGPDEALDYNYPKDENPAYKDNIVWQRVIVPKDAVLIEAQGFTKEADIPSSIIEEERSSVLPDPDLTEWERVQRRDDNGTVIGEEAGYRYFGNWVMTRPGSTTVELYRYKLPSVSIHHGLLNEAERHAVYIIKQPGDARTEARIELRLPENVRFVHTVPHDGVTQMGDNVLVYRGSLKEDVMAGGVATWK